MGLIGEVGNISKTVIKKRNISYTPSAISAIFDAKLTKDETRALKMIFRDKKEEYFKFYHDLLIVGKIHQSAILCE